MSCSSPQSAGGAAVLSPAAPSSPSTSSARIVFLMVLAALAIRLATMTFMYQDRLDPKRNHWRFAWEMGMVARSIATGKGYSSPYVGETGPTAWFPPVYPYLLATIFKVFGLYTKGAAITSLALNSLFSALTTIPIFFLARATAGARVARYAGWLWAFYPYSIWAGSGRIWENALSALLLATLMWITVLLDEAGPALWLVYGVLWGIAGLTNPSLLAVMPVLLIWILWRRYCRAEPCLTRAAAVVLAIAAVLAPWIIRNYRVFHTFVPLRSNFWVEVRVGNTGDISDIYPDWAIPSTSSAEWNRLRELGEIGYAADSRLRALAFIRENPAVFAWLTEKHIIFTWTGFWNLDSGYAAHEPFQIPNILFCSALTVLMLFGLAAMWRQHHEWIAPYLAAIGAFPLVYYITHPAMEYRHPIEPAIVILIACAIVSWREGSGTLASRPGR